MPPRRLPLAALVFGHIGLSHASTLTSPYLWSRRKRVSRWRARFSRIGSARDHIPWIFRRASMSRCPQSQPQAPVREPSLGVSCDWSEGLRPFVLRRGRTGRSSPQRDLFHQESQPRRILLGRRTMDSTGMVPSRNGRWPAGWCSYLHIMAPKRRRINYSQSPWRGSSTRGHRSGNQRISLQLGTPMAPRKVQVQSFPAGELPPPSPCASPHSQPTQLAVVRAAVPPCPETLQACRGHASVGGRLSRPSTCTCVGCRVTASGPHIPQSFSRLAASQRQSASGTAKIAS